MIGGPQQAMPPAFEYHHTVTFEETNAVGNVYFATYFKWQGLVRELFLAGVPTVVADLTGKHALVTVDATCSFYNELWPFDRLVIRLTADPPVQNRLTLRYDYFRATSDAPVDARPGPAQLERVARGDQTVAWFLRGTQGPPQPVQVPLELVDAIDSARRSAGSGLERPPHIHSQAQGE